MDGRKGNEKMKRKKVWAACQTEKKRKQKQKHVLGESKFFDSSNREVSLNSKQDCGTERDLCVIWGISW